MQGSSAPTKIRAMKTLNIRSLAAAALLLIGVASVHADDLWRVRPGEVYNPSTYCNWNRSGLPAAQQKICANLDKKNGVYKSNWRRIEANNGAAFALDVNSIHHSINGNADVVMCIIDNDTCIPPNMRRWLFDCHGHYMDIDGGGGMQMAPPRSVAGATAAIACVGAKENSPPEQVQSAPAAPQLDGCTQERAAELARPGNLGNDTCLVHWRAIEVRKHPERATLLECNGLKAYEDPQPPGHPVLLSECDRITREDQQRMGLPATGLTDEMKATYRRTWGQ